MKRLLFIFCITIISFSTVAQENYTIDGENLELYNAAEGDLTLLWNVIDGKYRYFVVKDGQTYELTNARGERGNRYQGEYKKTLEDLTPETEIPTEKVKLTLGSLKSFINEHNAALDENYVYEDEKVKAQVRLGVFGGITNAVYSPNITNEKTAVFGGELELYSNKKFNRHSIFTQVRHVMETEEYDYNYTGLTFNYRFKVINAEWFHFYLEAEAVELYYTEEPRYIYDSETGEISDVQRKDDFSLDLPLSLGAGVAIRVGKETFFTLSYNDFVALGKDNNGEFPIDFTAGFKFNL
ncbi:hypothetical protein [Mesonia sp.]|uniref:hypothetical protein n=1 Tax=Mesonia sp. TaxID=1960830 RepID=UPI001751CA43|nr:hypothetical protein [Mesonia sp.]HIB36995.1 hypothetical protein [Mesonia sp.]HIO26693.1 hypothetical protein [Flavobacteriaceae bacterium]